MPRTLSKKKKTTVKKSSVRPPREKQPEEKKKKRTENPLLFKISKLWGSPEGTVEKISIDTKVEFNPVEVDATSNLKAELMFIKLKNELSVILSKGEITVNFLCNRCLKPFKQKLFIESAEREFLSKAPSSLDDITDYFFIDMKAFTVDLTDMIRQEIILHFPFIQVCSNGCRGLCSSCGKDRNKTVCNCKDEEPNTHKPFKNLKNLLQ